MTPTILVRCRECSSPAGPFWQGYCPACIDDFCANGSGEDCGLPAVPEEAYDDTILAVHRAVSRHTEAYDDGCMFCALFTDICDECDIPEEQMMPEDEEAHLIVDGIVLIGCQGYHEPAFRYVYWSEVA